MGTMTTVRISMATIMMAGTMTTIVAGMTIMATT